MTEDLYFIAVLPPLGIQKELTLLKEEIAEKFKSRHALKSPPHITLHMPFKWKDKKLDQLQKTIESLNEALIPFTVALKDFDFFEPRVVFVAVEQNEKLQALQKVVTKSCRQELKLYNANYKGRIFHPHITIGFRDLKKPMFYAAKKEFERQQYAGKFIVDRLWLLKNKEDRWEQID